MLADLTVLKSPCENPRQSPSVLPVPNLLKAWCGFAVAFSSWCNLHISLLIFFSFSEFTAFTSRSVALAVNSGLSKNCANLKSNNLQCHNCNFANRCFGLPVAFRNMYSRFPSSLSFARYSLLTALTSLCVALSVNRGQTKNWENLKATPLTSCTRGFFTTCMKQARKRKLEARRRRCLCDVLANHLITRRPGKQTTPRTLAPVWKRARTQTYFRKTSIYGFVVAKVCFYLHPPNRNSDQMWRDITHGTSHTEEREKKNQTNT